MNMEASQQAATGQPNARKDSVPVGSSSMPPVSSSSMPIRSFSLTSSVELPVPATRDAVKSPPLPGSHSAFSIMAPFEAVGIEDLKGEAAPEGEATTPPPRSSDRHTVMSLTIPGKPAASGRGSAEPQRLQMSFQKTESEGARKSGRESVSHLTMNKVFSVGSSWKDNSNARRSALMGALNVGESDAPAVHPQRSFLTQENLTEIQMLAQKVTKKREDCSFVESRFEKLQRIVLRIRLQVWLFLEEPFDTWFSTTVSCLMVLTIFTSICHSVATWDKSRSWQTVSDWDIAFSSIFFTDLLVRFWSYPAPTRFLKDMKNVIDVVCLLPFFINGLLDLPRRVSVLAFLRWLSAYEAFLRLLKLSRYFWGWRLLFHAIYDSAKALIIPMLFLVIVVLFGSCTLYIAELVEADDDEYSEETSVGRLLRGGGGAIEEGLVTIDNLPDSIHFCIISILGISTGPYYNLEAASPVGRAGVCAVMLFGMLFMAMPIAIVGNCFSQTWFDQDRIILLQKMRDRLQAQGYSPQDLEDVFDEVDENGSGELDFDNFRKMIATFNLRTLNAAKCRQLFHYFDNDADGVINLSDFALTLYPDAVDFDEEDSDEDSDIDYPDYDPNKPAPPGTAPRLLSPVGEAGETERDSIESIGHDGTRLCTHAMTAMRLSDIPESPAVSARPTVTKISSVDSKGSALSGVSAVSAATAKTSGENDTTTWALPPGSSYKSEKSEQSSEFYCSEATNTGGIAEQGTLDGTQEIRRNSGPMVVQSISEVAHKQSSSSAPAKPRKRSSETSDVVVGVCAVTTLTSVTEVASISSSRSIDPVQDSSGNAQTQKRDSGYSDGCMVLSHESLGGARGSLYSLDSNSYDDGIIVSGRGSIDSKEAQPAAAINARSSAKSSGSWDIQCWEDEEPARASMASAESSAAPVNSEAYKVAVVTTSSDKRHSLESERVGTRGSLLSMESERSDCHHLSAPAMWKRNSQCSYASEAENSQHLRPGDVGKRISNCSFNSGVSAITDTPLRDHDPLSALVSAQNSGADPGTASMNSAMYEKPRESHPALAPIEAAMVKMEARMDKRLAELKNLYIAQMGTGGGSQSRPQTSTMFHGPGQQSGVHGGASSRTHTPRNSMWRWKGQKETDHHRSQPQSRKASLFGGGGVGSGILDDEDHGHKGGHHKRHAHKDAHKDQHKDHDGAAGSPHDQPTSPRQGQGAPGAPPPPGMVAVSPGPYHRPPATAMAQAPTQSRPKRMLQRAKTTGFKGLLKKH